MYDIIFDFSSSPTGGALRRLEAYVRFFSKSSLRTFFLINENTVPIFEKYNNFNYECIYKNNVYKIFGKNKYLNKYINKANWLFSYGIPVENPIGKYNWFHISNALPLADFKVTLNLGLKFRMWILGIKITRARKNCKIVSAESNFSLNLYKKIDDKVHTQLLENSFEFDDIFENKNLPDVIALQSFGLIVGTASYKRLDIAYSLYLEFRSKHNLDKLIIIGNFLSVDKTIRNDINVIFLNNLSDNQYFYILKSAKVFISTSEIENSSCAVLEALFLQKTCYLSDIPSHQELLLGSHQVSLKGYKYIYIPPKKLEKDFKAWDSIISTMLKNMKFIT